MMSVCYWFGWMDRGDVSGCLRSWALGFSDLDRVLVESECISSVLSCPFCME